MNYDNHGGARTGAGRPKKSGSTSTKTKTPNLTVIHSENYVDVDNLDIPDPHKSLLEIQADGTALDAETIFKEMWEWIGKRGCTKFVDKHLVNRYALVQARLYHVNSYISQCGYLSAHPTTGNPMQGHYVAMSEKYMTQVNRLSTEIYAIVTANSTAGNTDTEYAEMETLFKARR